jgi:sugar/nucleoside kinase (ribokinase family)
MIRLPVVAKEPSATTIDVVGLGECSIDHVCVVAELPGPGAKMPMQKRLLLGGGQVATMLVGCRRLGLSARYLGKVGDDADGARALEELAHEGLDTGSVRVAPGARTRSAVVLVDAAGERTIVWDRDPRVELAADEVTQTDLRGARALHVDATSPAAALRAVQFAREAGVLVSLDVDSPSPGADELVAAADLCVVSEAYATVRHGEPDPVRALRALRARNPHGLLCVTRGARGSVALEGDTVIETAAFGVQALDTTGCGDVFRAGLLAAALAGMEAPRALAFASATAALKTRALGGRAGIPSWEEVTGFLAERGW